MYIETGNLLFMDIETVSAVRSFDELSERWQMLWTKKNAKLIQENETVEAYYKERAALSAEFGKIVCISLGYYNQKGGERIFRLKSLYGEDEKKLLKSFSDILVQFGKVHGSWSFAGHNIKEFDLPYISRRLLMNGLEIPAGLDFLNLKPWEYNIVDTMQIWRFGEFKNYASLDLLTASLDIPSPKSDIDGSQVGEVFWSGDFKRIAEYCQRDVVAVANIIQRLNRQPLLDDAKVEIV